MATKHNRMAELVFKHLTDDLSEQESIELNQILADHSKAKLFEELTETDRTAAEVKLMSEAKVKVSWKKISGAYDFSKNNVSWKKYLAAAAIILPIVGVMVWYFYEQSAQNAGADISEIIEDVYPKSRKAIWKRPASLAVMIDDLANGIVGYSQNMPVIKNDSELVYSHAVNIENSLPDTVETLRGGFYRLRLPDGSKVWLNSATSVFFASVFAKNERQVSVNGEAFFDVVKDPGRPFYVHVPGLEIEVMGTKFNIQAYKEERFIRTTLIEGSVKVRAGSQVEYLKPGEQAVFTQKKKLRKVSDSTVVKKATAWKDGAFIFENDDLKEIIGELGRWYDLDVQFNGIIPEKTYYGVFSRSEKVETILGHLQTQIGIHFTKENKKIVVQP